MRGKLKIRSAKSQHGEQNDSNGFTRAIILFLLRISYSPRGLLYLPCPSHSPRCFPYSRPIRLCLRLSSCSFVSQIPFVLVLSQRASRRSKIYVLYISTPLDPLFFTYITSTPFQSLHYSNLFLLLAYIRPSVLARRSLSFSLENKSWFIPTEIFRIYQIIFY